jgi:hypothetical protein
LSQDQRLTSAFRQRDITRRVTFHPFDRIAVNAWCVRQGKPNVAKRDNSVLKAGHASRCGSTHGHGEAFPWLDLDRRLTGN